MNSSRIIVVWGAGRIGRGFVAHLFHRAGWSVTIVDSNSELIAKLKAATEYTIYLSRTPSQCDSYRVRGYAAYRSDSDEAVRALRKTSLVALAVFTEAFESVARSLSPEIERRSSESQCEPFNIIICSNTLHAAQKLREQLLPLLSPTAAAWFEKHTGVVESLVLRVAVQPSAAQLQDDALCVMTNGYPDLIVDRNGFKGTAPSVEGLVLSPSFTAEETRKLYTYNLLHAVYAYMGNLKGYRLVSDACRDSDIDRTARGALTESGRALCSEFGFTPSEMAAWNAQALADLSNPLLGDTLERLGADPVRKLSGTDRLVGPALLCLRHGIRPYFLSRVMAAAFTFGAQRGTWDISTEDCFRQTVRGVCGLTHSPQLVQMVVEGFREQRVRPPAAPMPQAAERAGAAYEEGFRYERKYKGCAQCTLLSLSNTLGPVSDEVFEAASGFSGGIGLCGDGVCGGYSGGVMFIGTRIGRRRGHLEDGDKDRQYKSYEMAQKLHDRFIETYGSVLCSEIHKQMFGQAFCLRTVSGREQFEAAGAHVDKCTAVVALACMWVAELVLAEES